MSKRLNNFEALRILAMFMVIILHYLNKGGLLTSPADTFTITSYVAWLIEAFAIIAVNVYVLITGYFMCESTMKVRRLFQIILQVLWYSILIPIVLGLIGIVNLGSFQLYDFLLFCFPIHMKQYWFVTAYVLLLLFVPFLNIAIKYMNQKKLLAAVILMTIYQTLPMSILPVKFTDDEAGNSVLWLVCLYLIAAYIRKYGIPFFSSLRKSLICYLAGVFSIFAGLLVMRQVYFKLDAFGESINFTYNYNHLFCLFASVALFYTFLHWKIKEGMLNNLISRTAPYTFGVYLFHEHILVRNEWPKWLNTMPTENIGLFFFDLIWRGLFVLVAGMFLDWCRACVFKAVGAAVCHTPIAKGINKLDEILRS